jgi:hypothetical protein
VVIEGASSSSVGVDSGVPQGSVLGPLLFLCYINDLPQAVRSQVRLFADDCLLYRPVSSIEDQVLLQQDLTALQEWASTWGMKFNAQKCYILQIHSTRLPIGYRYNLCDHILECTSENPYLGVLLQQDLKWSSHINRVVQRASQSLGFIRRNLKYCPAKLKETAYITLVRSKMEYGASVWDPHTAREAKTLEAVQRRAARFVKNDYGRFSSVTAMLGDLQWKTLATRRRNARLVLLYKTVNDLVAIPTDNLVKGESRTRADSSGKFRHLQSRTNIYRYSFFPRTVGDWNSLPADVRLATSLPTFKGGLVNFD